MKTRMKMPVKQGGFFPIPEGIPVPEGEMEVKPMDLPTGKIYYLKYLFTKDPDFVHPNVGRTYPFRFKGDDDMKIR